MTSLRSFLPVTLVNMSQRMLFSLERQFAFYQSYHQNRKNRLIHILSLPVLIFTFLLLASYSFLPPPVSLDAALAITLFYCAYVIFLDLYVGIAFIPYAAVLYLAAVLVSQTYSYDDTAPFAFLFHVLGWVCQLVGHYKFEARAPALLTSFVHAVSAAPFVVYLELLFSFGLMSSTQTRLKNASVVRKVKNAQRRQSSRS